MKSQEIRALTKEDLESKIATTSKELQALKFAHVTTDIENPLRIKDLRRFLARLKTELHQRFLGEVQKKVKENNVTEDNAREFLAQERIHGLSLLKLKKILGQNS